MKSKALSSAEGISRRTVVLGAAGLLAVGGSFSLLRRHAGADVIVIGAGAAGLSAAVAAAEAGASVMVVEKQPDVGGNTLISGGYFAAVDPVRQQRQFISDSESLFLRQMLESGGGRADPKLARVLVGQASDALLWLEHHGMRFQDHVIEIYGAHWPRCHKPMMPSGRGYIYTLSAAAAGLGVDVTVGAQAFRIEVPESGKGQHAAVWVKTKTGDVRLEARKGIVLASGGFGANRDMIARHAPELASLTTDNTPGSTGEMLNEAQRLGASLVDLDAVQCLPGCPPGRTHRVRLHNDVSRFIFVDQTGRRFIREDERRDVLRDAILALPNRYAYTIIDDAGLRSYNIIFQKEAVVGIETGDAWRGNTIAELARYMGLPAEALERTVYEYNEAVDRKFDPLGKSPAELSHRLIEPPFWGCYAGMTVHYTMGGVRIDEQARVLRADGTPIRGLYAAGEVTGGVHGVNRMGANGINDAVVFGRIAGRSAAQRT